MIRWTTHACRALLLCTLPIASAGAQVEAGRAVDDSTLAPLVGSRVVLQSAAAGKWKDVETTRTDAQGLFQFGPHPPGVYRVALLGKKEPMFFGAVDTLAADSMQQREFRLPVVRRSAVTAYAAADVDRPAEAIAAPSSPPPDPSSTRIPTPPTQMRVEFVVDERGAPEVATFRTTSITNEVLIDSIKQSLMSRRFHPATIGGIPVRQVVEETIRSETRIRRVGGR